MDLGCGLVVMEEGFKFIAVAGWNIGGRQKYKIPAVENCRSRSCRSCFIERKSDLLNNQRRIGPAEAKRIGEKAIYFLFTGFGNDIDPRGIFIRVLKVDIRGNE